MRVTTTSTYATTARNLGAALSRSAELTDQISSGRRLKSWSDDAVASNLAEGYRLEEHDLSSFQRSAQDAQGWMASADGTLQSMSALLTRVRELAVSAVNGGISSTSRTAVADEIDELREQLRDYGNTEHLGRPLFGGLSPRALTDNPDGSISFTGDTDRVRRQVSPTIVLDVNVNGQQLFGFDGPAGTDVFSTLKQLADSVRTGDLVTSSAMQGRLEGHAVSVGKGLSFVGATANRVDAAHAAGGVALDRLAERRSELEEVDLAQAVLQLNMAQAAYQAALGAAAKSNLPTLADFLK